MALPRVLDKSVLALRIERGTIKNGIIIPGTLHQQKEYQVCAIGPNVKEVVVGDVIVIGYGSHEVIYNEVPYAVVDENQVLAILPQE